MKGHVWVFFGNFSGWFAGLIRQNNSHAGVALRSCSSLLIHAESLVGAAY